MEHRGEKPNSEEAPDEVEKGEYRGNPKNNHPNIPRWVEKINKTKNEHQNSKNYIGKSNTGRRKSIQDKKVQHQKNQINNPEVFGKGF